MTVIHAPKAGGAAPSPSAATPLGPATEGPVTAEQAAEGPVTEGPVTEERAAELLFPEAKRRERRRRVAAVAALLVASAAAFAVATSLGGSSRPARGLGKTTAVSPVVDARAFSHEGLLAFTSGRKLYVLDGNNGSLRQVGTARTGAEEPTFSRDGKWLAYIAAGGETTTGAGEEAPFAPFTGPVVISLADGSAASDHRDRADLVARMESGRRPPPRRVGTGALLRHRCLARLSDRAEKTPLLRRVGVRRALVTERLTGCDRNPTPPRGGTDNSRDAARFGRNGTSLVSAPRGQ